MTANPYREARALARARRDFLIHVLLFVAGLALVLGLAALTGDFSLGLAGFLVLWLVGLATHGLSLLHPLRKLSRLIDRLAGRPPS